jgi:nucleoside-diphosphate-sugar epimerase
MRIFLAGAAGVIGRRLTPLLVLMRHEVSGTTRSAATAGTLEAMGARPVIVDAYDAAALTAAIIAAGPEVVIHQLTDLPDALDRERPAAALEANARLRIEGTRNLMAAARAAGARRVVAQSIAFAYAPGPEPHGEDDPLNLDAEGAAKRSADGVAALEAEVLGSPPIEGIVLRYGRLYGPGTWSETPNGRAPLHVDAAAHAALLALTRGGRGIYNIAEDDGAVSIAKARALLGFDPTMRLEG